MQVAGRVRCHKSRPELLSDDVCSKRLGMKWLGMLQGVHPGRLVVNKPDIPLPMHRGRKMTCSSPESCSTHADVGKSAHSGDSDCR